MRSPVVFASANAAASARTNYLIQLLKSGPAVPGRGGEYNGHLRRVNTRSEGLVVLTHEPARERAIIRGLPAPSTDDLR